ncbi:hypothetical protein GCM10023188_23860 [Pontibacter saemangeumensis]|uniref:Uncharacterized protein n=1 Tax=Pontibacter saemangeumensis TaxID=1084525 RepID=A0ABP8LRQ0_9BACT
MRSFLYIVLVYLCLSLLVVSCSESNDPAPACMQAEVVGPDACQPGWYVLKLQDDAKVTGNQSNSYIGQLHGGYVTTSTLPGEYRQAGRRLSVSLEVDDEPTQICTAVNVIYPTVRVVRVCAADDTGGI